MCGIAGILKVHPPGTPPPPPEAAIPEAWLDILDDSIKHRGPDGHGRFRDRTVRADGSIVDVALVHRRLAIIDRAGGHQPMVSIRAQSTSDGHGSSDARDLIAVVFNGCIYNHRELRRELQSLGHEFLTDHSDTEVLIHGWRAWGPGTLERLEGMYAIAVWDRAYAELTLARDRFGEKPLYFVCPAHSSVASDGSASFTAFSSSAAAIKRCLGRAGLPVGVSALYLKGWIALGALDVWTPFENICQVPPGGRVVQPDPRTPQELRALKKGSRSRPAVPRRRERPRPLTSPEDAERLLDQAVRDRLEADVPLACFLSGGVDSSLVAVMARRHLGSLRTLTVRMNHAGYDESAFAESVARRIDTDHHTIWAEPDPAKDVVRLITQLGLPFGDSSLLPTYWISRAASVHARVCLSGDGGDELFMGYERYVANRPLRAMHALWPLFRLFPANCLDRSDPRSRSDKLARLLIAAGGRGYQDVLAIFQTPDLARLLHGRRQAAWYHEGMYGAESGRSYDLRHTLPGDMLRKVDTASMAAALEVRAPFLDTTLAAAALATPRSTLMPRGQRKGLLRQVARKYLPADIVDRPKMGFAIPIGDWFRTDYGSMRTLLMDHMNAAEPFPGVPLDINMKFVRRMIDEHMSERRDHSQRLYMLLVLSIWARWLKTL